MQNTSSILKALSDIHLVRRSPLYDPFTSNTELHKAVETNDLASVPTLSEDKSLLLFENEDGENPFHLAVKQGNHAVLHAILKTLSAEEELYIINKGSFIEGQTPLHFAVINGDIQTMQFLLQRGANREATDFSGQTPLHRAAQSGNQKAVMLLLGGLSEEVQCRLLEARNHELYDSSTVLHSAAKHGHALLVSQLLSLGANVKAEDENGNMALHHAVCQDGVGTISAIFKGRKLHEILELLSCKNKDGDTPLTRAIKTHHQSTCDYLIKNYFSFFMLDKKTVDLIAVQRMGTLMRENGIDTTVWDQHCWRANKLMKKSKSSKKTHAIDEEAHFFARRPRSNSDENHSMQNIRPLKQQQREVDHLADLVSNLTI